MAKAAGAAPMSFGSLGRLVFLLFHMRSALIIMASGELVGLYFIWRLWRCNGRRTIAFRVFWSALLLIPVLGVIFYGVTVNDPAEKPGWGDENNQGWGDYPSEDSR